MSLVTVIVNRNCGHCLRVVDTVTRIAERTGTTVAAVDVTAHPELAIRFGIKRSPAVLIDEEVTYPGVDDGSTYQALCSAA